MNTEITVMICRGYANGQACPYDGMYLESFTPFEETKGSFTSDPDKAMRFADKGEAFRVWRTVIGTRPWDGKPDRPLTAFNMEIGPLEEQQDG